MEGERCGGCEEQRLTKQRMKNVLLFLEIGENICSIKIVSAYV